MLTCFFGVGTKKSSNHLGMMIIIHDTRFIEENFPRGCTDKLCFSLLTDLYYLLRYYRDQNELGYRRVYSHISLLYSHSFLIICVVVFEIIRKENQRPLEQKGS